MPYIFKKDKAILNLFRKTITEFYAERLSDFRRADDWYGFEDNIFDLARELFEGFKTILKDKTNTKPDENVVYRIMFDLFQLAGYPFTPDQITNSQQPPAKQVACKKMRA